jgi:hypothetical protein
MAMIEGKLTSEDVEVLIESMDYWETTGNREFHIMEMFRNMPLPEADHEAFEPIKEAKKYFAGRERDIKADRALRKEKATILKAKLMLMRQDMAVDRIFDVDTSVTSTASIEPTINTSKDVTKTPQSGVSGNKLAKAEAFLDQSGIKSFYDKFLDGKTSTIEQAEQYINECGMSELWKKFLAE